MSGVKVDMVEHTDAFPSNLTQMYVILYAVVKESSIACVPSSRDSGRTVELSQASAYIHARSIITS